MRRTWFGLVLLVAVGVTGCIGGSTAEKNAGPAAQGQRSPEQALAESITSRLGKGTILEVQFAPPPASFDLERYGHRQWMYVKLPSTDGPSGVHAKFDAALLAGAYNHLAASANARPVTGLVMFSPDTPGCARSPAADSCEAQAGTLVGVPVPDEAAWPTTESASEQRIRARLDAAGVELVSIAFEHPTDYPVPLVVVRAGKGSAFAKWFRESGEVFGDMKSYEGYYIGVVDAGGNLLAARALTSRLARGTGGGRLG